MFRFALLGAAAAFSDETSLMQGLKPVQDVKKTHDKHAVANLLESAKGMLKNGETADVVTFAQATLDEIMSTVIPAIQDAHNVEQVLLRTHFAEFEAAVVRLSQGVGEVRQLDLERHSKVGVNIECRNVEAQICEEKQYCDYGLYNLWRGFIMVESDLRSTEEEIYHRNSGHFCAEDAHGNYIMNGTTHEFREASVPIMHDFTRKWPLVITAEEAYDAHRPNCQTKFEQLDDKTAQCHADQTSLEDTACQHRIRVKEVIDTFTCDWEQAMHVYDLTEREARLMQLDRIREFQALTTVQCLLARTTERNGRPCDEHTDEITAEMTTCEERRRTVDISSLELEFPCEQRDCGGIDSPSGIGPHLADDGSTLPGCDGPLMCPEIIPQCAVEADGVLEGVLKLEHSNYDGGRCIPPHPEHPCTAGEVFPGLPGVPQPDFHAQTNLAEDQWALTGNSHCNQREPCQDCQLPETPECPVPDWVWSWYTTQSVRHSSAPVGGDGPCACEVTDSVGHLPSTNLGTQGALVVTNTMNEWVNTRGGISSLIVTKLSGSGICQLVVATGALGAGALSHVYGEGEHHYPMTTGNDNIGSFNLQCNTMSTPLED